MSDYKLALHPSVAAAIEEQQTRVWRLRNLLDAVRAAVTDRGEIDVQDPEAALDAILAYADEIHLALDGETLVQRAAELEEEKRAEVQTEERRKAIYGTDEGSEPPPQPTNLQ